MNSWWKVTLLILIIFTGSVYAVEWNSRFGVELRGPVIAPLFKGSGFTGAGGSFEPFMMGLNANLGLKYGFTESFAISLNGGYSTTYDDSSASSDKSFAFYNSNNAGFKLTGIRLGLEGQYYFYPEGSVQPYLLAGAGLDMWSLENQISKATDSFKDFNLKYGVGIAFWLGEQFIIDLQGKMSHTLVNISPLDDASFYHVVDWGESGQRPFNGYLEPSVAITYFFGGPRDSDEDGIKDKFDQCPDTPFGALVDEYGCPKDTDGDRVYDGIDACDDTPIGAVVDLQGCPLDNDQDGIFDGLDKCPNTPLGVSVDPRGCPLDTDGDRVPDFKDKEADTPLGAVVDADGVALDGDIDGVPDGIDKCPDTPANVSVDDFGCPKAKPLTEKIILNIKYASGSFKPDVPARKILDGIYETMRAYPSLNIEINGYTDALGSKRGNKKLSVKRAGAVMDYLSEKGVPADRMKSAGYGEEQKFFIGDNATPEGRQKNRRVEIVPVQQPKSE